MLKDAKSVKSLSDSLAGGPDPGTPGALRPARRSRAIAILRQTCPNCFRGRIFEKGFRMFSCCPICGWRFVREPGFFLGAMYLSYMLVIPPLAGVTLFLWLFLLPDWPLYGILSLALGVFLVFVPAIVRYSRVLYLHLEHLIEAG
jgi:uncharacterized protein (DUF983 family)